MKTKLTILTFLLLNILTYSEIRYVSPQGSNTAPFISWATASHTIQGCIDVSSPGDTIYVGNGVYKEVVTMTKGLALIGSGIDSCIIDTRELAEPVEFRSVIFANESLLKGFRIIVSKNKEGDGVIIRGAINEGIIEHNLFQNSYSGCYVTGSQVEIRNNIFNNNSRGINISSPLEHYKQQIYNNIISEFESYGIAVNVGANGIIYNNIFYLDEDFEKAFYPALTYNLAFYSNLIIAEKGMYAIANSLYQPIKNYNNVVIGSFKEGAITAGEENDIRNNVVINGTKGIAVQPGHFPTIKYNNVWNNTKSYINFTPDSTNISVDPMFVNEDSLDFHLQRYSPLIDAGDPEILDKDGSRSDIGLLGGPYGSEEYKYIDYPPRPPVILDIVVDSSLARIILKKNTEADFSHYNIYRSNTPNFIIDSLNLIKTTEDTSFTVRINEEKYYYKITGIDKQGKESRGSEEIELTVTGIEENKVVLEEYKLYQNYPNPFNPSTIIGYRLKKNGKVRIVVYDIKGERIEELINEYKTKGYHEVKFEGKQQRNISGISSGVYIYRIEIKDDLGRPIFYDMKKMIFLK